MVQFCRTVLPFLEDWLALGVGTKMLLIGVKQHPILKCIGIIYLSCGLTTLAGGKHVRERAGYRAFGVLGVSSNKYYLLILAKIHRHHW